MFAPRSLMQVVYVLSDNVNFILLFKFNESKVARIWLGGQNATAALVVKTQNQLWISIPRVGGGDILDPMLLPKPI